MGIRAQAAEKEQAQYRPSTAMKIALGEEKKKKLEEDYTMYEEPEEEEELEDIMEEIEEEEDEEEGLGAGEIDNGNSRPEGRNG